MHRLVLAAISALTMLATSGPASAQPSSCSVYRVEGDFADGALIYEYTAPSERLRVFRATCRGGEIYVHLDIVDMDPIEMRVIEAEMPLGPGSVYDRGDNAHVRFSAFAVPRMRYTVYEYSDGSRAVVRGGRGERTVTIGTSRIRRGPGGVRVGERIGEATIPPPPPEAPPPPPPSPDLLLPVASDDPANWADVPFMQPNIDPQLFAGYHPQRARERFAEGSVLIGISVGAQGNVENVVLLSQTNPGWSFELAAAAIARQAIWPTTTPDGRQAPYRARMRVRFQLN